MISLHERDAMPVARAYTDFASLNDIKAAGREDSAAGLRQVAEQFEAIFIDLVLESMRKANSAFAEGNYLQSNETEFHQQSFDDQLSLHLAGGKGLGLAEPLYQQMLRQYQGEIPAPSAEADSPFGKGFRPLPDEPAPVLGLSASGFDGPEDFVRSLLPFAREAGVELGVDPQLLLAQSALETGWGRRLVAAHDGSSSFNLFAIKADQGWQGRRSQSSTIEFDAGVAVRSSQSFRNYDSFRQSFEDYVGFLKDNPRYERALAAAPDSRAFATELQNAGYATDPRYAEKVIEVMRSPLFLKAVTVAGQEGLADG